MTKDEALKRALEALEFGLKADELPSGGHWDNMANKAITALRQALEQPEVWTQKHWTEYERSIAAAENEACAKVCEVEASVIVVNASEEYQKGKEMGATVCAASIRGRMK